MVPDEDAVCPIDAALTIKPCKDRNLGRPLRFDLIFLHQYPKWN